MSNYQQMQDGPAVASKGTLIPSFGNKQQLDMAVGEQAHSDGMTGALSRRSSGAAHNTHETYSPFVAYSFTINFILGVGVLSMPIAFYRAGWMLSSVTLFIVSIVAIITALWLVEVGRRTAIIATSRQLLLNAQQHDDNAGDPLVEQQRNEQLSVLLNKCYEVNEIVEFHLGIVARRIYEINVIIYLLGALWSYASVFASSMSSNVPVPFINNGLVCDISLDISSSCHHLYLFYLALMALICVPISCLELTEMKLMGIVLAAYRFIALGLMMITSVTLIWSRPLMSDPEITGLPSAQVSVGTTPPYYSDMAAIVWTGIGVIFPISIYAQIFHHSVPGLAQPLRNKSHVPLVFIAVVFTTCVLYCLLGFTVSLYFGSAVNSTCTLNWSNYSALYDHAWWAKIVGYTIVLFPPIDIISAFPLNAITLGNNILTCFVHDPVRQKHRPTVVAFRLVAVVPPLIGSMLVHDLASILQYTGCVGVLMAFLFPLALQWKSSRTIRQMAMRHELSQQANWKYDKSTLSFDESATVDASVRANWLLGGPLGRMLNSVASLGVVGVFSIVGLIVVVALSIVDRK